MATSAAPDWLQDRWDQGSSGSAGGTTGGTTSAPASTERPSASDKSIPKDAPAFLKDRWAAGSSGRPEVARLDDPGGKDYWTNPINVAMHYNGLLADTQGLDWAQLGIDADFVKRTYDYFSYANGGKPWWEWKNLADDDPATSILKQWSAPPPEVRYGAPGFQWTDIFGDITPAELYAGQPPAAPESGIITPEQLSQLPAWQQIYAQASKSSLLQGAAQMLPLAIGGALLGLAAGPLGAIAGAISPLLLGAVMGGVSDPRTGDWLKEQGAAADLVDRMQGLGQQALWTVGLPGMWTEQAIGTGSMLLQPQLDYFKDVLQAEGSSSALAAAALKRDRDMKALLDNLGSLWDVSQVTYEAAAPTEAGMITSNFLPGVEWVIDTLLSPFTGKESDVRFAGLGEVFLPYQAEPVKVDKMGTVALQSALRDVLNGAAPEQTVQKYMELFGLSGQVTDLIYQSILDPLNVMPLAEAGAIRRVAQWTDNPTLATAARLARSHGEGAIGTYKAYGTILRAGSGVRKLDSGLVVPLMPWEYSKFQRTIAGVTREGTIKELTPGVKAARGVLAFVENPFNPLAWWTTLNELTPKAKAQAMMQLAFENAMIGTSSLSVDEAEHFMRAWAGNDPRKAAAVARMLGMPEAATVAPLLGDYVAGKGGLNDMSATWKLAAPKRKALTNIAAMLDEKYTSLVKQIEEGQITSEVLYQRVLARKPELANDPAFKPESFKELVTFFKKNWWAAHPEFYKAHMRNVLLDRVSQNAIKAYGVKPGSGLERMSMSMRALQNIVLLNLNPAYLINNVTNNVVMRAYEGVFGLKRPSTISNDFKRLMGGDPYRLHAGIGPGDIDTAVGYIDEAAREAAKLLRDAGRGKGLSQSMLDFSEAVNRKLAFVQKASQAAESFESMQAMHAGVFRSLPYIKQILVPQMDPQLVAALRKAGVDPARLIAAFMSARSPDDIDKIVRSNVPDDAAAYVPQAALALGMDAARVQEMLEGSGVLQELNRRLSGGAPIDDAMDGLDAQLRTWLSERQQEDLISQAEDVANRIQAEGMGAALDIMFDIFDRIEGQWTRHMADLDAAFERANTPGVGKANRSAIIGETMAAERQRFQDLASWVRATYSGVLKALQFDPDLRGEFALRLGEYYDNWEAFMRTRDQLWADFAAAVAEMNLRPGDEEYRRLKKEVQDELGRIYAVHGQREHDITAMLGQVFEDMVGGQFGDDLRPAAFDFFNAQNSVQDLRRQVMADFRAWERGDVDQIVNPEVRRLVEGWNPDRAHALWPQFHERVYIPILGQYIQAGYDGVMGLHRALGGDEAPERRTQAQELYARLREQARAGQERPAAEPPPIDETPAVPMPEDLPPVEGEAPMAPPPPVHVRYPVEDMRFARRNDVLQAIARAFPNITSEQAMAYVSLIEARANAWARTHGRTPDEYYQRFYAIRFGDAREEAARLTQAGIDPFDQRARAAVRFTEDGRAIITGFEKADASSLAHELGHVFLFDLEGEDAAIAGLWAGAKQNDDGTWTWTEAAQEKFAEGFVLYLREGRAPTAGLRAVFEKFKAWLLDLYRAVADRGDININPTMRSLFDRLLSDRVDDVVNRFEGGPQHLGHMSEEALARTGWKGGRKRLMNAVNADRRKVDLPAYKAFEEVPWHEAQRSFNIRNPKSLKGVERFVYTRFKDMPDWLQAQVQEAIDYVYKIYNEGEAGKRIFNQRDDVDRVDVVGISSTNTAEYLAMYEEGIGKDQITSVMTRFKNLDDDVLFKSHELIKRDVWGELVYPGSNSLDQEFFGGFAPEVNLGALLWSGEKEAAQEAFNKWWWEEGGSFSTDAQIMRRVGTSENLDTLLDGTSPPGEPPQPTLFQLAPPRNSAAFDEWFSGSKVVDENGDALVVYHGTNGMGFTQFEGQRFAGYFTTNKKYASFFATGIWNGYPTDTRGAGVYPVMLSIKNPVDTTKAGIRGFFVEAFGDVFTPENLAKIDAESKFLGDYIRGKLRENSYDDVYYMVKDDLLLEALKGLGYDGIHLTEWIESRPDLGDADTWVAFEPEQVKSVFNKGTWDRNNPSILFQLAPPRESAEFNTWFGDSKVVDDIGEPLRVYHGTGANFDVFRTSFHDLDTMLGYHFAVDPDVANRFALGLYRERTQAGRNDLRGGVMMPVYLSIQKPYEVIPFDKMSDTYTFTYHIAERAFSRSKELFTTWWMQRTSVFARNEDPNLAWLNTNNAAEMAWYALNGGNARQMGDKNTWGPMAFKGSSDNFDYGVGAYVMEFGLGPDFRMLWGPKMVEEFKLSLEDEGYDGVIYKNTSGGETGKLRMEFDSNPAEPRWMDDDARSIEFQPAKDVTAYIAFKPGQVKSVHNRGTWDQNNPSILFQLVDRKEEGRHPVWYSQLRRVVDGIRQERMTVEQLEAEIKKGAVKADELKWTGMDEWLAARQGQKVTRAEVLQFLQDNRVDVREVWKGGTDPAEDIDWRRQLNERVQPAAVKYNELQEKTIALAREVQASKRAWERDHPDVRWPQTEEDIKLLEAYDDAATARTEAQNEYYALRDNFESANPQPEAGKTQYSGYRLPGPSSNYRELLFTLPRNPGSFTHAHWGEENVVAHTRFDERVDVDGRRTLYVDEVQSDWHQTGREKGYGGPRTIREITNEVPEFIDTLSGYGITLEEQYDVPGVWAFYEDDVGLSSMEDYVFAYKSDPEHYGDTPTASQIASMLVVFSRTTPGNFDEARTMLHDLIRDSIDTDWDAYGEFRAALGIVIGHGVPGGAGVAPAPFAKSWPELVMKRMLRYAAENGFERLSWSTGEIQGDRWTSLVRARVDELQWDPRTAELVGYKNGNQVITQHVPEDKLAATVGKDIAADLLNTAGEPNPYLEVGYGYSTNKVEPDWYVFDRQDRVAGPFNTRDEAAAELPKYAARTGVRRVKGENIRVGAEGMRAFYDDMLPRFMEKYGKKFGAKVREGGLTGEHKQEYEVRTMRYNNADYFYISAAGSDWNADGKMYRQLGQANAGILSLQSGKNIQFVEGEGYYIIDSATGEPEDFAGDFMQMRELLGINPQRTKVWSMDITPEMRTSVNQGQSLFQLTEKVYPSISEMRQILKEVELTPASVIINALGDNRPDVLADQMAFILRRREKFRSGGMTPRDYAKAYITTISSVGSDANSLDLILEKGFNAHGIKLQRRGRPLPPAWIEMFTTEKNGKRVIRPEEFAALWITTDDGRAALDAIERGEYREDLWNKFADARRDTYGRLEKSVFDGAKTKKYSLRNIGEFASMVNMIGDDPVKVDAAFRELAGISYGKSGFIGHMLGFGEYITVDTQEINAWIGMSNPQLAAFLNNSVEPAAGSKRQPYQSDSGIASALRNKFTEAFRELPLGKDLDPSVWGETMHHWLWSKVKGGEFIDHPAMRQVLSKDYFQPAEPPEPITYRQFREDFNKIPHPLGAYVGNKRTMLQGEKGSGGHYADIIPSDAVFTRIVDAFGGSGLLGNAMQIMLGSSRLLNDFDPKMANFHLQVRDNLDGVLDEFRKLEAGIMRIVQSRPKGDGVAYDMIRTWWDEMKGSYDSSSPERQAAIWILLHNGTGFGDAADRNQNLIEGKAKGFGWKVTKGKLENILREVVKHSGLIKRAEVTNLDARELLRKASTTDLVLLDPPYVPLDAQSSVMDYAAGGDLVTIEGALAFIRTDMAEAAQRGVPMIYTNNYNPEIVAALTELGFRTKQVWVRSQRTQRPEVVAWNDAVLEASPGLRREARERARPAAPEQPVPPDQQELAAVGPMLPGALHSQGSGPLHESQVQGDAYDNYVRPVMHELRKALKAPQPAGATSNLDPAGQEMLGKWMRDARDAHNQAALGALRMGEMFRDNALLNYERRYNFDSMLSMVFPYQFWATRSMVNWALRIADRPGILAMFARLSGIQHEQDERDERLPSRLRGKMFMPMAFLPDWMGDGVFTDPLSRLFPFREQIRPYEQIALEARSVDNRALDLLKQWLRNGEITQEEYDAVSKDRSGPIWDRAATQAKLTDGMDWTDYASLFVSPALYLTVPYKVMTGRANETGPFPPSRMLQALSAATGIQGIQNVDIEAKMREGAGLSPYGQWGDYYIDRQLVNMVADGLIDYKTAEQAMIERSGEAYEQAVQRVQQELMFRMPGMGTIYTARQMLAGNANLGDLAASLLLGLVPGNILPAGEIKLRGLQDAYDEAWKKYKAGDKKALNVFLEQHPEFEARAALYRKPEERVVQFLRSEVWDRYDTLSALDKKGAREQFGAQFNQFLSGDYEGITNEMLASWAQAMGGVSPGVEAEPAEFVPAQKDMAALYQQYLDEKSRLFPGLSDLWAEYFQFAKGSKERKAYWAAHPELGRYSDWQKKYLNQYPELEPLVKQSDYADMTSKQAEIMDQIKSYPGLITHVQAAQYGERLSRGSLLLLRRIWESNGAPYGSFRSWLEGMGIYGY